MILSLKWVAVEEPLPSLCLDAYGTLSPHAHVNGHCHMPTSWYCSYMYVHAGVSYLLLSIVIG